MNGRLYEKIALSYSSDARSSYLMVHLEKDEQLFKHQIATLAKNPVHSILQFKNISKDDIVVLCYDITSKQTLSQTLKRKKFSKTEITDILLKISRVIINADNYFLYEDNFILNEDYIYVNPATLEISLVYIPIPLPGKQLNTEFYRLVNKLITNIDNTNEKNNEFVHNTLVEINKEPFNLSQFAEYLAKAIVGEKDKMKTTQQSKANFEPERISERQFEEPHVIQPEVKNIKVVVEPQSPLKVEPKNIPYKVEKVQDEKKKKTSLIILVQVFILIVLALIFLETDLLIGQEGVLDVTSMAAMLLIAGVADYLIVKKLLQNTETKTAPVKAAKLNQAKPAAKSISQEQSAEDRVRNFPRSINNVRDEKPKGGDFATELLNSDSDVKGAAYLTYTLDGKKEKKKIDGSPFIIGKLPEQVDFVINSKTVSRVHAEIYIEKDTYYIVDLNSRNGTYLNGEKILSNTRYQLKNNDILTFAREEFTFIQ